MLNRCKTAKMPCKTTQASRVPNPMPCHVTASTSHNPAPPRDGNTQKPAYPHQWSERPWLWLQQSACTHRSPRAKERAPLGVARTLLTSEAGFAWLPALSVVLWCLSLLSDRVSNVKNDMIRAKALEWGQAAESAARAKGKKATTEMADSSTVPAKCQQPRPFETVQSVTHRQSKVTIPVCPSVSEFAVDDYLSVNGCKKTLRPRETGHCIGND